MDKFLMYLKIVPALFELIKSVEAALPEGSKGKEKLDLIEKLLESAYTEVSTMWPAISQAIGVIVTFYNAMGIFTKKSE